MTLDFVDRLIEKRKVEEIYFDTDLTSDLEKLKLYIKQNDMNCFATDGIYYFENERTDYEKLLKKIFEALASSDKAEKYFDTFTFNGCKFSAEIGQGSLYIVEIVE